ncbi:ligase-associated DNA damage response endonuclease PdeM [Corallococcus llansteffanensis]|uniref:Ligase-associated DNA damage response endonuclease PdeM n=1 Tax=Corallococcus llansteffanensis TaxID=2316731 RepID=A0A3A8QCB2_9BACT|nr:ligase-associated DNA damage response endonuclease PdeM [Corallococcus llansteffanensis]RKH65778.1 ligase-associated DNA damage response endonuclease PdeM [Corallococcus llansteffanensis]
MVPGRCQTRIGDADVELLPERALHWPQAGVLAVADLHWGKTESFQQHGIPLPLGVLDDDLTRLSAALTATRARRLLLVGDLVHSRQGLTGDVIQRVSTWREAHPHLDVVLIRGNHDRHVRALPPAWNMEDREDALDEGPFRFAHHPEPAPGRFVWAGHLHPMVRLDGGADRLRLPCFHLRPGVGVLPAFSAFTGGLNVRRGRGDRVFAIAGTAVVEV